MVVFRHEAASSEPFGMWFLWVVVHGHLLVADLQNSTVATGLSQVIAKLDWAQPPRDEAFFVAFR